MTTPDAHDAAKDNFDPALFASGAIPSPSSALSNASDASEPDASIGDAVEVDSPEASASNAAADDAVAAQEADRQTPTPEYHAGRDIDRSSNTYQAAQTQNNVRGDQYNINNYIAPLQIPAEEFEARPDSRRVRQGLLTPEARAEQAAVVVPPFDLENWLLTLRTNRVLVIGSEPGRGHTAASIYLVHQLLRELGEREVRRVPTDPPFRLSSMLKGWERETVLIANLVDAPENDIKQAQQDLVDFRKTLGEKDSYLVLSVPLKDLDGFRRHDPVGTYALGIPDATAVFRKHLEFSIDDLPTLPAELIDALLTQTWVVERLRQALPAEAARYARLVKEVYATEVTHVWDIVDAVRSASEDWSGQLRAELDEQDQGPDPWRRSLLLASAALEGAGAAVVVNAAELFLKVSKAPCELPHPLLALGAVTQLQKIKETSLDPKTTTFTRLQYGRSVLSHVWSEYPALRQYILAWLSRVPTEVHGLKQEHAEALADRVVELAARHDAWIVTQLAWTWAYAKANGGKARLQRSMAVRLLGTAAIDQRIGRTIRERLYQWAKSTSPELQLVVAQVCGSDFGLAYPSVAFTRLRHLANSSDEQVRRAVTAAVMRMTPVLGLATVLGYLTDWLDDNQLSPAQTNLTIQMLQRMFSEIGVDRHTAAEPKAYADRLIIRFWRCAYKEMSPDDLTDLVQGWLEGASQVDADRGRMMVEQLARAAEGDIRNIGQLFYATRNPEGRDGKSSERLRDLFALLRTRLDEIDPIVTSFSWT